MDFLRSNLGFYLELAFVQRAIVACLLLSILAGLLGFYVVLRRMAFVVTGLSHAALGGVALGVVLGQSPTLWAIGLAVLIALAMAALGRQGLSEDTSMGIFFPAAMAFGVVLIGLSPTWQRDLMTYLFGSVLAIQPADLWLLAGVTVVVGGCIALLARELLFISLDEDSAHAAGVPVASLRALLLVLCAVAVVVAIKVLGVILVSAMLVIPAATAGQLVRRWPAMLAVGCVLAAAALLAGLALSFAVPSQLNLPVGAAAVLVAAFGFGLATAMGQVRRGARA